MEDVTPMKMSQFRDGNFGRFDNQEAGIPVYLRAAFKPDSGGGGGGKPGPLEVIEKLKSLSS